MGYRTIAAKFPSFCTTCHNRIQAGDTILWDPSKELPTKHVKCQPSEIPTAPKMRRKGTRTGCTCGSVQEYTKSSDCWTCQHDAL